VYVSNYCDHSITVIQDPLSGPYVDDTLPTSLSVPSPLATTSNLSGTLTLLLPNRIYLPVVMRNHDAAVPRVVYTIDLDRPLGTVRLPPRIQSPLANGCTGNCPKGIGFYGDYVYVSLFQSGNVARIDRTYNVEILPIIPTGVVTNVNQFFGWAP
jgi:hypothetical protein